MENSLKNYELITTKELKDTDSTAYVYRHKKSGARVICLKNTDKNKVFTIGFKTPSNDSTGVQHIIEHSVLCGSKKFPAKDPFVELAKGSLNTFLNAMTYPDKTVYPVASCNMADFKNLMDVYLDAVFFSNIYKKEEIFKQEGWHYESDGKEYKLNGVVFNEMKGVYSSPEDVLVSEIFKTLYKDTPYEYESGGDPEVIPSLTYENFLNYHKSHYHPANSYIYLYGDMDMEERLDFLDKEYLSGFFSGNFNENVDIAEKCGINEPIYAEGTFAADGDGSADKNSYLSVSWIVGDTFDVKNEILMQILDYVLISAPGAILKQKLVDTNIGTDISSIYETSIKQPFYSIIVKNTDAGRLEEFKKTVNDVFESLCTDGFDINMLLAGLNILEFKYKEADFGRYPKGLIYGLAMFDTWLYDDERPFLPLECGEIYEEIKACKDINEIFKATLKKNLMDNKMAAYVTLKPDPELAHKKACREEERVLAYVNTLSDEEKKAIEEDTVSLKRYQDEPSSVEDLEKIPLISISDIEKKVTPNTYEVVKEDKTGVCAPLIKEEIFTNGISYVTYAFDASCIKPEDYTYLGLLSSCIGLFDAGDLTYQELTSEINKNTGGISTFINAFLKDNDPNKLLVYFVFSAKALEDNTAIADKYILLQMFESKYKDKKRMKEIVERLASEMEDSLLAGGHQTSARLAMAQFSKDAAVTDKVSGYEFYTFLKDFLINFDEKFDFVTDKLEMLANSLFNVKGLVANVTAEKSGQEKFVKSFKTFADALKDEKRESYNFEFEPKEEAVGLYSPSQVNYVARAWNFGKAGEYNGALEILKIIFSYDYLWLNIRVKGGAYGCMSGFLASGDSFFTSYRDPNIEDTLDVYSEAYKYVETFAPKDREMDKYIIGTIGGMDTPLNPSAKGLKCMFAYLSEMTDEKRQKVRDEILSADAESIRELAPLVKEVLNSRHICVVGNKAQIQDKSEIFDTVAPLVLSKDVNISKED